MSELSDSATGSALGVSLACRRAYICVLTGFLPTTVRRS